MGLKSIGTVAALGLLAIVAILAMARPWAGGNSNAAHAFETGEWRAILEDSLAELLPGTGFTQTVETYSRHGAAADRIRETSLSYVPERWAAETTATFSDDGSLASFTYRQLASDGSVLRETVMDGGELVALDHVAGTSERHPIPQALASIDELRDSMVRRDAERIEEFLTSRPEDIVITESDDLIIVRYQTGLPFVTGGGDGWTVPYVADLDVARAFHEDVFEKTTYRLLSSHYFAELTDGTQMTLERIVIGELKIIHAGEVK
jgi:hypothetical protein